MLQSLAEKELSIGLQNCEVKTKNLQLAANGVLTVSSAEEVRDLELSGQLTVRSSDKQLVELSVVDQSIIVDIKSLTVVKLINLGKGEGKKEGKGKNEVFAILEALQHKGYPILIKYKGITVVKDISNILKWLSGHAER